MNTLDIIIFSGDTGPDGGVDLFYDFGKVCFMIYVCFNRESQLLSDAF